MYLAKADGPQGIVSSTPADCDAPFLYNVLYNVEKVYVRAREVEVERHAHRQGDLRTCPMRQMRCGGPAATE